jgi:hypothetical protein
MVFDKRDMFGISRVSSTQPKQHNKRHSKRQGNRLAKRQSRVFRVRPSEVGVAVAHAWSARLSRVNGKTPQLPVQSTRSFGRTGREGYTDTGKEEVTGQQGSGSVLRANKP